MVKHAALIAKVLVFSTVTSLTLAACQLGPTQQPSFDQRQTGNPLDLALEDDGRSYFVLTARDGAQYFTRDGAFNLDAAGTIIHAYSGYALAPQLTITGEMTNIAISPDGQVTAKRESTNTIERLGEITLARFADPSALSLISRGIYTASPGSGPPNLGRPSRSGYGLLMQGFLETPRP